MSLHDHAKKNQYFLKNTSTQVVLDKHAGALDPTFSAGKPFFRKLRAAAAAMCCIPCRCQAGACPKSSCRAFCGRAPATGVLGTAGAGINEKPHYSCP
jgi:hypothetical protein